MHYGFRIVEDMIDGLSAYMDDHGFRTIEDFRGRAVPNVKDWGDLDLNYKIIADIRHDLCIGCQLCYVACEDGAHQCIEPYTVAGNGKKNPNGMGVTFRASLKTSALAAIFARSCARWISASQ